MSRVIKFRAIIPQRNATIIFTLQDLIEWKFSNREVLWPWIAAGNTPDQFTGITDRNGVEIYESDVVRWLVNTDHSVDAPVGFESGAFYMLDAINQGYGKVYNDWLRGDYTVLGNIYEHPELLEAKP